jgi:hypothetical protein
MPEEPMTDPQMTDSVRVPRHVVYREFSAETVVLNLQTGLYHGLNGTGGRMLQALDRADTLGQAAERLSEVWGTPRERLDPDLRAFCAGLAERGLLEVDGGGDR